MERRSQAKDIHKTFRDDLLKVYNNLDKQLGDDNPFAKPSLGAGYYVWADKRREWQCMTGADGIVQDLVRAAYLRVKEDVEGRLGAEVAARLFTIPDDSYIYYDDSDGDIKVLVTGWGFKYPARSNPKPDLSGLKRRNGVSLAFIYDGERLAGYEFGLQLPRQLKRLVTDGEGYYCFADVKTGISFTVKDFASGKEFVVEVVEGKSLYEFDVTRHSTVTIIATYDGAAVAGEGVAVACRGKVHDLLTDSTGRASVILPWHEGETVTATMRGHEQTVVLSADGNDIRFAFETPVADIEVSVVEDGKPVPGAAVEVAFAGSAHNGTTGSSGLFAMRLPVTCDDPCTVTVDGYEPKAARLEAGRVNVFRFEKTNVPKSFAPRVLVVDDEGRSVAGYPVSVEHDGVTDDYVTDEGGIVVLPEMQEGRRIKVVDGRDAANSEEHDLDEGHLDYVLHVPSEPEPEPHREVNVTIVGRDGRPLRCDNVRFSQEGRGEIVAKPDDEGRTHFDEDAFAAGETLTAAITAGGKDYAPVDFTLDEGEYDYLLQERDAKSPWLSMLLQGLLIVAFAAAFYLAWPVLVELFSGTFDNIYH